MIRWSVFICALLLSFSGRAAINQLSGDYIFLGELRPLLRTTVEVFDHREKVAPQKLSELRSLGYQCQFFSPTYRCTRHFPGSAVSQASLDKIKVASNELWFRFGKVHADPALVSAGDYVKEWSIGQDYEWPNGKGRVYRGLELTDGLQKFVIEGKYGTQWLNAEEAGNELLVPFQMIENESKKRWHQDLVEAVFVP